MPHLSPKGAHESAGESEVSAALALRRAKIYANSTAQRLGMNWGSETFTAQSWGMQILTFTVEQKTCMMGRVKTRNLHLGNQ